MSRDYKSRATRKQKKSLPGYVWLLSGLAIGLFIAFIVYLDKQPENDTDFGSAVQVELEKLKQQAKKKDTKKAEAVSDNASTGKKEQKFNFYTLLPELEVLIPENETRPPDTKNKTSGTSKTSKQYVLQVGSFQNLDDAEKLKANLAFLGLSASIQHVTVNKQAWHRVRTGPYKDKQQLYKNQKTLKRNNIQGIPMELK
ncbi:MAG: SPOR domain-containing protein [Gammaproteobacteria bacterium]